MNSPTDSPNEPQAADAPSGIAAPPPAPSIAGSLRSLWRTPAFMVVFVIMALAAGGLTFTTSYLQLHFKKQPVSLQRVLKGVPLQLGPWTQVNLDMPLSHDIQEVLGTDNYIFRDYVDTRVVPAYRMAEFEGKDYRERSVLLDKIRSQYPAAVVSLSVTYYTGMVDTVAHIPDRCFIADGFVPTEYDLPKWKILGMAVDDEGWRLVSDGGKRMCAAVAGDSTFGDAGLPVRFINFEDQDLRRGTRTRNVTYFFQVNGRYEANPLGVRKTLQDLFQKNGYYAKVELMTMLSDRQKVTDMKRDFLSNALPELEKCLPDWNAVVMGTAVKSPAPLIPVGGASTKPTTAPVGTGK